MGLEKLYLRLVLQDIFQGFAEFAARLASDIFILNYLEFTALGQRRQNLDKVMDNYPKPAHGIFWDIFPATKIIHKHLEDSALCCLFPL